MTANRAFRSGLWTLSIFIAAVCFVLMLTIFRAAEVINLSQQVMALRQENGILHSRLSLYMFDLNTQSYLDRWLCSQARENKDHERRIKKLEGGDGMPESGIRR